MSMYADYLKEREGLEVLETELGFVAYKFRPLDCYIQDIYVVPTHRKAGVAASLADRVVEVAKFKGYHILTGSVDQRAQGSDDSAKVLIAYGMQPYTVENSVVYYYKEI